MHGPDLFLSVFWPNGQMIHSRKESEFQGFWAYSFSRIQPDFRDRKRKLFLVSIAARLQLHIDIIQKLFAHIEVFEFSAVFRRHCRAIDIADSA